MLIVSSLEGAPAACAKYRPKRVISLLSDDEAVPRFSGVDPKMHLSLYVERETCADAINAAARQRAAELVKFVEAWNGEGDILVHCNRGIARSTAAAFIIMCMRSPKSSEAALARAVRKAAPFADPCPLLVSYADEVLGRDGRMIEAIEDLSAPSTSLCAPTVVLPLAA
jgi:predicted protein tyrosine phosphatase